MVTYTPTRAGRRGRPARRRRPTCVEPAAANLHGAIAADDPLPPMGLLVDYRLDSGNGLDAIRVLRARYGDELPAILITADRSPDVREEARASRRKTGRAARGRSDAVRSR